MTDVASSSAMPDAAEIGHAKAALRAFAVPMDRHSDFDALTAGYHATGFQKALWLRCWFETIGDDPAIEGFWMTLRDAQDAPVMALPILRLNENGFRVLTTVDLGLSDYNAPLLMPRAAHFSTRELWGALKSALPKADLLHIEHMPTEIEGLPNPIAAHPLALPERISGWSVALPESFEGFRAQLSNSMRDQMAKATRRFARVEGHENGRVCTQDEARETLKFLEDNQERRLAAKGFDYILSQPTISRFYHRLVEAGLADGRVVMATLRVKGALVAANFGICENNRIYYLRLTNIHGEWAPFKLGLLVTEHLARIAIEDGVQVFDFTIGDYDYKRRFAAKPHGLRDLDLPLSWRGWVPVLKVRIKRRLGQIELFQTWKRRLLSKKAPAPVAVNVTP